MNLLATVRLAPPVRLPVARLASKRPLLCLLLTLVLLTACSPASNNSTDERPQAEGSPAPASAATETDAAQAMPTALVTIASPDLSAADAKAREQIRALEGTIDTLRATGDTDPSDLARHYGELGSVFLIYDFIEAAEGAFDNARFLAPAEARWHYLRAYLDHLRGALDDAAAGYRAAIAREDSLIPAKLRLGRVELERGDLAAARGLFTPLVDHPEAAAPALAGLAQVTDAEGELRTAIDLYQRALALAPKANSLHYAIGQAYRKIGDLEQAERSLALRGDVPVRIVDPMIGGLGTLGQSAQLFLMQAAEAMEDGDWRAAAGAYETAIDRDPSALDAYRGLAVAVERLGDTEAAIGHLKAGLRQPVAEVAKDETATREQTTKRADLERTLAGMLVVAQRDREAIVHFRRALELDPKRDDTAEPLANALARQGQLDDALAIYDRLIAAGTAPSAALLIKRATLLVNLGRGDRAVRDFEQAIATAPEDAAMRLRYADALTFLGRTDAAARQRQEAGRLAESDDTVTRIRLLVEDARARMARGDFESAVTRFDQALAIDPDQPPLRFELARLLGHLGYLDDALREFRTVADAVPGHAEARRGEVTVLLLAGRFGEARVRLQDALASFPLDAGFAHVQARLLSSCPDEAVRDGGLALEISNRLAAVRDDLSVRETQAMALAAAGRFGEAVALQRGLIDAAAGGADATTEQRLRLRLERFAAGEPWIARSGEEIVAATQTRQPPETDDARTRGFAPL